MSSSLRRLVLATSKTDREHACLVPIPEGGDAALVEEADAFACPCGQTFPASLETVSWTTEYARRCLVGSTREFTHNPQGVV